MIEFYIGVVFEDREEARRKIKEKGLEINGEFDNDYFTIAVKGSWDDYRFFRNQEWVKSIEHFEEDIF